MSIDWQSDEFQKDLEAVQDNLKAYLEMMLFGSWSSLKSDEVYYIAEELSQDFGHRLIQVIRKGIPK